MVRGLRARTPVRALTILALIGTVVTGWSGRAEAAVVFTVNSARDSKDLAPDGACDVSSDAGRQCTLRAAIEEANAATTTVTIKFAIVSTPKVKTIVPKTPLPPITRAVVINGFSQKGASANTLATGNDADLRIRLSGIDAGPGANGLDIQAGGAIVQGLVIGGFAGHGINVAGSDNIIRGCFIGTNPAGTQDVGNTKQGVSMVGDRNTVGGLAVSARNLISGNDQDGIAVTGASVDSVVQNNYVGTDRAGSSALGNSGLGVRVAQAHNTTIGGTTLAARNVISGNGAGIDIFATTDPATIVQGNLIGTDASGTAAVANTGIAFEVFAGGDNVIGGTVSGAGNVISGNGNVALFLLGTEFNRVEGNRIGTNVTGSALLGNDGTGVLIRLADHNFIGGTGSGAGNVIAGNTDGGVFMDGEGNEVRGNAIQANTNDGVFIDGSDGDNNLVIGNVIVANGQAGVVVRAGFDGGGIGARIQSNQIFANADLGIDLQSAGEDSFGVTPNDTDDPDTGPNNLQNFPVITSATRSNTTSLTTIAGTLNSNPSQGFTIQCFVAAADPSNHGEAQFLVATVTTSTNAGGDASFACVTGPLPLGTKVVATAMNTTSGDSSEFSLNGTVIPGP